MKNLITFALLLIGLGSLSAQSFVRKTNVYPGKNISALSNGTLKILAVLVEFQQDTDGNTYGNGKFGSIYSKAYGDTILDPLPHDKKYFENHLEFAKNYFAKVSGGKLNIEYTVLPQVITVSKIMREYSPPPTNSSDLTNTGNLAQEVWQLAGTTFNDIDFSEYDLFTIFHAGVGKEFTPPGSLGGERDIPSIYFGFNSLKSIFGESFSGFPVNNFFIKNTMILPSTESRELETLSGTTLIQLTTNGLIVANIASHLGLPDLFNTETGTSAIGRLGLMDGEAIFGYSGVFPPEPSAWEKIYLGWIEPVVVKIENANLNVAAKLAAASNDTTLLKIPLNSTEYYLVENRQRDVYSDGLRITSKIGDQVLTYNIDRDKGRFQWYGVDTLNGVITDVDEFDWAVPGNGIVIWHIDEKIINENIAENKINVDINNKGVDVEEADGIQDIGEKFTDIFGETVIGQATEDDFWFSGNTSRLYKNKFSFDTKPNTKTNSDANSLITMENFSQSGNRMSFSVMPNESNIKLISRIQLANAINPKYIKVHQFLDGYIILIINESGDLIIVDDNFNPMYIDSQFSTVNPALIVIDDFYYVIGAFENKLHLYSNSSQDNYVKEFLLPQNSVSPITIAKYQSDYQILLGMNDGYILDIWFSELLNNSELLNERIHKISEDAIIQFIANDDIVYYSIVEENIITVWLDGKIQLPTKIKKVFAEKTQQNVFTYYILLHDYSIYKIIGDSLNKLILHPNIQIESLILSDLYNSGNSNLIASFENSLYVFNNNGTLVDNFPFTLGDDDKFYPYLLTFDYDNDNILDILTFTENGNIYCINSRNGEIFSEFPLSFGERLSLYPLLTLINSNNNNNTDNQINLTLIDQSSNLYIWSLNKNYNSDEQLLWKEEFGNSRNTSLYKVGPKLPNNLDFFPTERAYNWPNPVYENETNIRYYVSEDSDVTIRIFDLAGDLVANLTDRATGGYDNETVWNVSSVQSGVYYASIEVKSNSGKTANKVIKIAVIK